MSDDAKSVIELSRKFNEATRPRSLYELVQAHLAVLQRIDDAEGEVDDAAAAELDALTESLEQRAEVHAAVWRVLCEEAKACDRVADQYKGAAERKRAHAERLRERLREAMSLTGRDKLTTPTATLTMQLSPPKLVLHVDEAEAIKRAGPEFVEVTSKLRTGALKAAIIEGAACEFAHVERSRHLRIK